MRIKSPETIQLALLSDTHGLHRELDVPDGDVLIHSGDFTTFGKGSAAMLDFNEWLGDLPHRHKIVVPGNHEFFLESDNLLVLPQKIWLDVVHPQFANSNLNSSRLGREAD